MKDAFPGYYRPTDDEFYGSRSSSKVGAYSMTAGVPFPQEFVIGRRTYFDFGPPFDFHEVFSVHSTDDGSSIERLTLTPADDACTQPPTLEVATASVHESVADLLVGQNPCSIPEQALRRERKRCKNCLVFSGASVTMQLECGAEARRIRREVLDQDLFDPAPRTPKHTSWTMDLLRRLDRATGPGVMERPALPLPPPEPNPATAMPNAKALDALRSGALDALFEGAPDKPSALYAETQRLPPHPAVELSTSSPFRPVNASLPQYPPIARLARIEGQVALKLAVTPDGGASDVRILTGHVILQKAVEREVLKWTFPSAAAGQTFEGVIEFRTNCPR